MRRAPAISETRRCKGVVYRFIDASNCADCVAQAHDAALQDRLVAICSEISEVALPA
jgi:hypothetical protein